MSVSRSGTIPYLLTVRHPSSAYHCAKHAWRQFLTAECLFLDTQAETVLVVPNTTHWGVVQKAPPGYVFANIFHPRTTLWVVLVQYVN